MIVHLLARKRQYAAASGELVSYIWSLVDIQCHYSLSPR